MKQMNEESKVSIEKLFAVNKLLAKYTYIKLSTIKLPHQGASQIED